MSGLLLRGCVAKEVRAACDEEIEGKNVTRLGRPREAQKLRTMSSGSPSVVSAMALTDRAALTRIQSALMELTPLLEAASRSSVGDVMLDGAAAASSLADGIALYAVARAVLHKLRPGEAMEPFNAAPQGIDARLAW